MEGVQGGVCCYPWPRLKNRRQMTKTHRKALKPLARIAVLIGIYVVFAVFLGLGLQVSSIYGNVGVGVTGVLFALYVYLGFVRGK